MARNRQPRAFRTQQCSELTSGAICSCRPRVLRCEWLSRSRRLVWRELGGGETCILTAGRGDDPCLRLPLSAATRCVDFPPSNLKHLLLTPTLIVTAIPFGATVYLRNHEIQYRNFEKLSSPAKPALFPGLDPHGVHYVVIRTRSTHPALALRRIRALTDMESSGDVAPPSVPRNPRPRKGTSCWL